MIFGGRARMTDAVAVRIASAHSYARLAVNGGRAGSIPDAVARSRAEWFRCALACICVLV